MLVSDDKSIFQCCYEKCCAPIKPIDSLLTTYYNFIPISITTLRKRKKRRTASDTSVAMAPKKKTTTTPTTARTMQSKITSARQTCGKSLLTSLFKCISTFYPVIVLLFMLNSNKNCNSKSMILLCDAVPMPTSLVLPPSPSELLLAAASHDDSAIAERVSLERVAAAVQRNQVVNLTRQHGGDVFNAFDADRCDADTCVGLSSGTAGMYKSDIKETDLKYKAKVNDGCKCQCLSHLAAFREDLNICVDDIHECTLAPFVSGSTSEKIPFVFLPLRGQIIHPSKEIGFQGIKAPICAVSGSQYLSTSGWTELRNSVDLDVPFRLFRDEGRTFLQWLGESDLRFKMQGRLILVHLMCRDMAVTPQPVDAVLGTGNDAKDRTAINSVKSAQNLFTPCVAFRVAGMPIKHVNNVTEVSFQSESTSSTLTSIDGLSAKEYILIAVCSLILGLIYVASVFLYIHVKRYKTRTSGNDNGTETVQRKSDYQPNDEVTFGNGFNRSSYDRSSGSITGGALNERHNNLSRNMSLNGLGNEEQGVIKSNPLLKHYPNLSDNSGFASDMSNSNSECGEERVSSHELMKNMQNPNHAHNSNNGQSRENTPPSPTQETECLPEENVSIIEDMTTEDKLENMKAIVSGTMRRKLYFNPAYFEPHLLMSPPPAAVEFLAKIREVITLAKYKMATKRFQPSLIMIPEEMASAYAELYGANNRISSPSSQTPGANKSEKKSCVGCPGCSNDKSDASSSGCKNCGEKRNSIRRWLEGVSKHENGIGGIGTIGEEDVQAEPMNETNIEVISNGSPAQVTVSKPKLAESSSSSDSDTVKANSLGSKGSKKRQAPPIPSTAPKIISHFLKKENHQIKAQPDRPAPIHKPINKNINNTTVDGSKNNSTNKNNSNMNNNGNSKNSNSPPVQLFDKAEIYNNLSLLGSEIYNNPAFMHGSPALPHRNKVNRSPNSTNGRPPSSKKRIDVLDQYANPALLKAEEAARNAQNVPDMVYEAIAKDHTLRSVQSKSSQDLYGHLNVPTPDYDDPSSTYSRKRFNNYENDETLIPPPDYNSSTLGRKQYQPDSPIYHRKSPHYLIVDYETDSLERTNTNKLIRNSFTPHSNNSSDLSSQPSPSLSSALPLEEEVEIGNTVYDRVEGYRKDGDPMKVIKNIPKMRKPQSIYEDIGSVSKAYLQSSRSSDLSREPRIKYNTPFHGSMTIEVEHEPTDEEISTDSDQFEPDTLDRKPKKANNNAPKLSVDRFQDIPNNQRNINEWPNRQHKQQGDKFQKNKHLMNRDLVDTNLSSLPDMSYLHNNVDNQVVLRSSGSFKSNSLGNYLSEIGALMNNNELEKNFSSLREIYEAKNQKNLNHRPGLNENEYNGRILTLEARHSKRQRQTTLDKNLKKPLPPDVIPLDSSNIYDIPLNPDQIKNNNDKVIQRNLSGWNNEEKTNTNNSNNNNKKNVSIVGDKKKRNNNRVDDEVNLISESLSSSSNSENTEITGVSDNNQANSEQNSLKQAYSQVRKGSKCSGVYNLDARRASEMKNTPNYMNLSEVQCIRNEQQSDCNSDSSTLKTGSTKFYYKSNLNQEANLNTHNFGVAEDLDKIDIISSKSLRLKDIELSSEMIDNNTKHLISELANDTSTFSPQLTQMGTTKVFHVDISPPTNGMQIALGIRDRVKKSKDLKHAWKKLVNIATSKFQGNGTSASPFGGKPEIRGEYDLVEKASALSDMTDKDDGIASLSTCDDSITPTSSDSKQQIDILSRSPSSSSSSDNAQKPNKNELDYGYISADSSESKAQKKRLYARFNFKSDKNGPEPGTSKAAAGVESDWRQKYLHRMQEIKENSESDRTSVSSVKCPPKPLTTKPTISNPILTAVTTAELIDFIPKHVKQIRPDDPVVRVYSSSDDEHYSSGMSSESDGEFNADELCESGAESIETHSVLFKNIRKLNENS